MNIRCDDYVYMPVIYNNWLPVPGYAAMMWWGKIYARKKYKPLSAFSVQHEEIHRLQAEECATEKERAKGRFAMAYFRYYCKYLGYWLKYGYRMIPFEQEARDCCGMPGYLQKRPTQAHRAYV